MFIIYTIFYIVLTLLHYYITNAEVTEVNAIAYNFDESSNIYTPLFNAFNEYSKANGLNINAKFTLLTPNNSTSGLDTYSSFIDQLLDRKSNKYDIYFYYGGYTSQYGEHFVDLNEYIPKKHLNFYKYDYLKQCNIYKNKLVGLPLYLDINVLYSNISLLQKYNKSIPKTWDEMIETAKFILEEERKQNNTQLIGYNGSFDSENGALTIYELIHSFRDSNSSPHPDIKSQATKDALMKYKQIKNEISSDLNFLSGNDFTTRNLFSNNAIFLKFWYLPSAYLYYQSALPGKTEGVSGSVVLATNVAITKYSKKKDAAVEVLKYITSKEIQKKYIIQNKMYSTFLDLYDDDEVCNIINCGVIKGAQPLSSVDISKDDFGDVSYVEKYRLYFYDYLINNNSLDSAIKKINDIVAVHKFSVNSDETRIFTILIIILYSVLVIIMASSLYVPKLKKFKTSFGFLPNDFWIISMIGTIMFLSSILTYLGTFTEFKCHLNIFLITIGLLLNLLPIFYKLIYEYPNKNKKNNIFNWIKQKENKYIYILIFVIIDLILNAALLISPYKVETIKVSHGENFNKCVMYKIIGNIILIFIIVVHLLFFGAIIFLIYIERNIEKLSVDIKYFMGDILIIMLCFTIYFILDIINIKNFYLYMIVSICICFIASITTYYFTFAFRIFLSLTYDEEEEHNKKVLKKIIRNTLEFSSDKEPSTNYSSAISSCGQYEESIISH